ncbi:uncharacterized protein [Blastocystis hominis]|uniref:Nucleotide-sugar transporter n=1 Tax=Blastocystis hominis TaxID=12968 RepID=D8LZU6_BLAHO|nr:uncharacterized protein [Blastocystis hominis]CBK21335.2 unnamed protein product [Blastocystis hominis]|eukprot:XP_012895383.1 uncharacterized protein [Blastocystis hominis]
MMQEKLTGVEEKGSKSSMMEENMKYISLAMLIFMNTAQVIFMRYARTVSAETYNSMTAVIMGEVMKIIMSFLLMVNDNRSAHKAVSALVEQARENTREVLFQSVPALLYTIQNFFMYVAISNLDAGIFQICTRMKILITALLSVLILGKKLRFLQWVSLFLLVLGVIIIKGVSGGKTSENMNFTVGFVAVLISSTSSSLAGVFMEKMFKDRKLTVWNRNFWLAVWSFNPQIVYPSVFFKNYNIWAWIAITLLAVGGLVIGLVLKYADNILKAFAGSASILFSTLISCMLFHTKINARFGVGAAIVMVAVVLYSYGAKGVQYKPLPKVETPAV